MIQESYCSYEVSKLLKEKEFPFNKIEYPKAINNDGLFEDATFVFGNAQMCNGTEILTCTHQMAMAWLREVHKINIVINVASDDDNIYSLWKFDIWNGNYSIIWGDKREKFNSYEQAVEAALKYTLENLI